MNKRASGVLMHVSSLPGAYDIDKKWLKELNDVYYRSK